ncbi:MAG: RpiB/LacA/LacB family sugar-phosphate isomerase [bacterium]|nr:RpiB/LacA/LacB family sugar-phosphate isomerase [bacterium]
MIYLGADHGGFALKERIKAFLTGKGLEVADKGNVILDPDDDYPDFALDVSEAVAKNPSLHRGILVCRNGIGMSVVANKVKGVRCSHAESVEVARTSRLDDDTNVLALPADHFEESEALKVVETWLETPFSGADRHKRRLKKIDDIERKSL